ncbi:hypothetical protein EVAR_6799_1 [Eumeta japonica]|uniref:Uncharacterized protein n=1 Tax=Eumeta variegata TaxID=151549 RepID=A0A4C1U6W5_EUMVA|nr:hypothetical protein EVAR_6799_1 [Eumeta japonica]
MFRFACFLRSTKNGTVCSLSALTASERFPLVRYTVPTSVYRIRLRSTVARPLGIRPTVTAISAIAAIYGRIITSEAVQVRESTPGRGVAESLTRRAPSVNVYALLARGMICEVAAVRCTVHRPASSPRDRATYLHIGSRFRYVSPYR